MIPPLVHAARELSSATGFGHSSTDEVGRLLRALVAGIERGPVAEIGTGCGVATAWMASALRPGVDLVTAELDGTLARQVALLFTEVPEVTVVSGDWHRIAERGPFALLFGDGGGCKEEDLSHVVRRGGVVVFDDFTDPEDWDEERRRHGDERRERWLSDRRYASTMVGVGRDKLGGGAGAQALIATRL